MSAVTVRRPISSHRWALLALIAMVASFVGTVPTNAHAATPPPSAPVLTSPASGTSVTNPVTMTWQPSTGVTQIVAYQWQVSSTSNFSTLKAWGNPMATGTTLPPTTGMVSGLANGTYFWRVQATQAETDPIEGLVNGAWSATRSFTVTGSAPTVLPAPVMISPPNLFQYHPFEFVRNAWNPVAGAHHYLLEYDNESTFTLPLFNADYSPIPAGVTTAPIMFGEPVGNLWFRVIAVSEDGTRSAPSNVRQVLISFNANDIPPAPLLTDPPNGFSGQLPILLDWADDANQQSYELQIGADPAFAQANAAECTGVYWCVRGIPESQWSVPTLPTGTAYWRVRSEHGDKSPTEPALSEWSAVRSFNVQTTAPSIQGFSLDVMTDNGLTVRSHTNTWSGTTPDNQVFGRLDLTNTIPPGGTVVSLTSSDPSVASVPASITVPPGCCLDATGILASFPIEPKFVTTSKTVTITASLPTGSRSAPLTVDPPGVRRIQIGSNSEPVHINGGTPAASTVLVNGAAPAGGATVAFTTTDSSLIPAPAPISLPAGASSANFTLTTAAVSTATTVTLTATFNSSTYSLPITLHPAPTLLAPAAGATFAPGAAVRFDWTDELIADELQVSTSPTFATLVTDQFLFQTSEYTTTSLPSGTLYWRARGMDAAFIGGAWSATSTITITGTPPPPPGSLAAPSLSSPANGDRVNAGKSVKFTWGAVTGAASYQLQVDDSSSFIAPLVVSQSVTATSFTVSSLAKGNRFWRVRAVSSSGATGAWSSTRSLTVK
jgi:hypothetical protein